MIGKLVYKSFEQEFRTPPDVFLRETEKNPVFNLMHDKSHASYLLVYELPTPPQRGAHNFITVVNVYS